MTSSMEEARSRKLGGSLKVPNVQELAKQQLAAVPPRYIRDDIEKADYNSSKLVLPQVPIIDMKKLLEIGDGHDGTELERIHLACKEWGFFQLVNHGVNLSLMEKVKSEIKAFFDLPMEEKKKFEQQEGDLEGYGQAFVVSEEQKLDWADILYMVTRPTNLRKPHLFPKLPASLRDALEQYSTALKELAMKIMYKMATALGMKAEDMNVLFEEDGTQMMRINYYPPCPQPELVMGLCPHTDAIGLTILLQVHEIEGLQIKKDGVWIPVPYLPDAFVVNIGDILEIVTNGIYKSTEHRAIVNEDKERISIATFLSPKLDGDLGPAPSLLTPQCPAKFRRIGVADYFKGYFSRELVGKSYVDTMRIKNGDDGSN
ncbi:Thebaine 6-O-demethylase [Capsicum chinense]|nr:Thebaine 6-O-demethylase [Capsicum chinense]